MVGTRGAVTLGFAAVVAGIVVVMTECHAGASEKAEREFANSIGMKFVRIPPGEFMMGSTDAHIKAIQDENPALKERLFAGEKPAHKVRLSRAFLMGKHEVTVGQFRRFVEATGYKTDAERAGSAIVCVPDREAGVVLKKWGKEASWRNPGFKQAEEHPVVCVSRNDAQKFAEWLSGYDKSRPAGWVYRLPTEAEWEYAARGPRSLKYPWGDKWDGTHCNFPDKGSEIPWADRETDDGYDRTAPVGSFTPKGDSPFGVCDMAGNVDEWCEGYYGPYEKHDQTDPTGPSTGMQAVLRGGSWVDLPLHLRTASRRRYPPAYPIDHIGFRLALVEGASRAVKGEFTNSISMRFVRIPAGRFLMGSTEADIKAILDAYPGVKESVVAEEKPAHKVRLTKAFLMGKHEVTVGQFRKFVKATGYATEAEKSGGALVLVVGSRASEKKADASWKNPYFKQADDHPVVCVSWNDARKFVEWLNQADKARPAGWVYRLPTEAEWEYAARGARSATYPWGSKWDRTRCNFADKGSKMPWADKDTDDGYDRTAPVGSFTPKGDSPFGVCDMAGNVYEWCEDRYAAYEKGEKADPTGPASGRLRVLRGGCWASSARGVRSAHRNKATPAGRRPFIGFRVVLVPGPK